MATPNIAAQALVEALRDPGLQEAQRSALLAALEALHAPSAKTRKPKVKVERKADTARLTRESIAAMPLPGTGETYVYDSVTPQLAVRIRPTSKTFVVVAWDRERQRTVKITLGKVEAHTPEQARKDAQRLVADVSQGKDVRRPAVEGLTLGQLIDRWHEEKRHSVRTADELRDKAKMYLGKLVHRPAAEVTRSDIGHVHHHIATKARKRVWKRVGEALKAIEVGPVGAPATADKTIAVVCSIYTWAMHKGLVNDNPASRIQKAYDAKGASRTRYLHGDELVRFWRALEADEDQDVRDVLKLALLTGQRRGNVLTMRWAAVDVDAGTWTITAAETKQRSAQETPLVAQAREILARRLASASGPWVFPGRGEGPLTETRVRQAWARVCKAAGIDDLRVHDLRHTSGSWLASLNVDVALRQRALGHHDSRSAARYSHVGLDPVSDAMQRVADAIEGRAKGHPPAKVRNLKRG